MATYFLLLNLFPNEIWSMLHIITGQIDYSTYDDI